MKKRLTVVASLVLAGSSFLPYPAARADAPLPVWAHRTTSLGADPLDIVATAPKSQPLKVVITRRTAAGPSIQTVVAGTRAAAARLIGSAQDDSDAIAVQMAQPVHIADTNDTFRSKQWALTTLRAETARRYATGAGVKVAVVDTGVQADHPDLIGRILSGYDEISPGTTASDFNGHGTHVAGIIAAIANNSRGIAGLATGARILPVRVLNSKGEGDSATVAKGIIWAAAHGAKVINLSLASTQNDSAIASAISYAESKRVVVVAAAGNDYCPFLGSSPTDYPAANAGVIGVGSIEQNHTISSFSSCGSWVDLVAPGGRIMSTYFHSRYASLSGTSMATPYVAAAAAMAIQRIGSTWRPAGVANVLAGTATDLGAGGRDNNYGYGLINPVLMLRRIDPHFSAPAPTTFITGGGSQTFGGRLLFTDGTAVAGATVTMSAYLYGSTVTHTMTTSSSGAFSTSFTLPRNVTFTLRYAGSASSDDAKGTIKYLLVKPRWAVSHTSSRVYVTNYSLYGQKNELQKKSGSTWTTVLTTHATKSSWNAAAGKGTWRVVSRANGTVASNLSATWTN